MTAMEDIGPICSECDEVELFSDEEKQRGTCDFCKQLPELTPEEVEAVYQRISSSPEAVRARYEVDVDHLRRRIDSQRVMDEAKRQLDEERGGPDAG
jgi:hypothetical protein